MIDLLHGPPQSFKQWAAEALAPGLSALVSADNIVAASKPAPDQAAEAHPPQKGKQREPQIGGHR